MTITPKTVAFIIIYSPAVAAVAVVLGLSHVVDLVRCAYRRARWRIA